MQRDNLVIKIRGLLAKTIDNGCTEHEALAALDKARAMMDAYEVTDEELQLTKELAAILQEDNSHDPHGIRSRLAMGVVKFCDCRVWRNAEKGLTFVGLPSDVELAQWLLATLTGYVQGELAGHLMGSLASKGERRFIINGFVSGATGRITDRLEALWTQSQKVAVSNSTALVLVKSTAVADKMKELGIKLGRKRRSSRRMDDGAYRAGQGAGDRASLHRPIGGGSGRALT